MSEAADAGVLHIHSSDREQITYKLIIRGAF